MSDTSAQAGTTNSAPEPSIDPNLEPAFDGAFDADRAKRTIANLREAEKRLKAQVAELSPQAQELVALKDAQKTELERLQEQLASEKTQREALERQTLRTKVGLAKGLPVELIDRLQGETEEALTADADALLAVLAPPAPGVPIASPRQGQATPPTSMEDPIVRDMKNKLGIA